MEIVTLRVSEDLFSGWFIFDMEVRKCFCSPSYRNNESIQTVPGRREILNDPKTNGFQYKFQRKNRREHVVEYFQCFSQLRLLVQMNVFKNLQETKRMFQT